MEASERPQRVDLGFAGGQVVALRLTPAEHAALSDALQAGQAGGWRIVTAEDAEVLVDLAQLVYVRRGTEATRVGF